jgi:hypothetical protein
MRTNRVQANAHSPRGTVRGTVLLNCAGGMNTKVGRCTCRSCRALSGPAASAAAR